ncbi:hypothetical protein JCM8097_009508 [Rhodosporidiobolus ruineniae]
MAFAGSTPYLYGYPTQAQLLAHQQQQQQLSLYPPPHPPPPSHSPYAPQPDLPYDPTAVQHALGQPGPSSVGLHDHDTLDALGAGDDEDEADFGTPDAASKKKGGRPRDRVWELFDGDRTVAVCQYCSWKTEHPKAFRMRTHVAACDLIPQEKKDELARHQEEKEEKKKLKDEAQAQRPPPQAANRQPGPLKKVKRDYNGEIIANAPSVKQKMVPAPPPKSPITCHVLDSTSGKPAPEMRIRLDRLNTTGFVLQAQGITDVDGRCNTLLTPGTKLDVGIFKITFFTNEYFTKRGILSFYPFVEIPFEVKSAEEHYHIPCLLSPYAYSTYRGS